MKRISAGICITERDQIGDVKSLMLDAIEKLDRHAKEADLVPDWTTLEVGSQTNYVDERTFADVRTASAVYTVINFEVRAL